LRTLVANCLYSSFTLCAAGTFDDSLRPGSRHHALQLNVCPQSKESGSPSRYTARTCRSDGNQKGLRSRTVRQGKERPSEKIFYWRPRCSIGGQGEGLQYGPQAKVLREDGSVLPIGALVAFCNGSKLHYATAPICVIETTLSAPTRAAAAGMTTSTYANDCGLVSRTHVPLPNRRAARPLTEFEVSIGPDEREGKTERENFLLGAKVKYRRRDPFGRCGVSDHCVTKVTTRRSSPQTKQARQLSLPGRFALCIIYAQ